MKKFALLLICALLTLPLLAQDDSAREPDAAMVNDDWRGLPLELAAIRVRQAALQATTGVQLRTSDVRQRSLTGIRGVPPEFRDLVVRHRADLEQRIGDLYPYLGFSGTESLRWRNSITPDAGHHRHNFQQFINGMGLVNHIMILVQVSTGQVVDVTGSVQLDRGFSSRHAVDAEQALALVRQYAAREAGVAEVDADPRDEAVLLYREWGEEQVLAPWWAVHLYLGNSWLIDPDGVIQDGTLALP